MNIRRCLSCVLLLSVCFYVLFSHSLTVHASEYEPDYYIRDSECTFIAGVIGYDNFDFVNCELGYGFSPGKYTGVVTQNIDRIINAGTYDIQVTIEFEPYSTPLGLSFNSIQLVCSNYDTYVSSYYHYSSYIYTSPTDGGNPYCVLTYKGVVINSDSNRFNYLMDFETVAATPDDSCDINLRFSKVLMMAEDETPKVLGNIFDTVKNIFSGILELPSKILDGIKNLFIPSEEDITDMKDKWTTLLSDRFGALYQVFDLIIDYANAFIESEEKTITFPTVTIPLGEVDFVFGGWEVQVVPDGFDVLIAALKMVISIVCTVLFVNGMRSRFDKILGGSEDV